MPFVGPSGRLQDHWIEDAGLYPPDIRYENVYPYCPPQSDIENISYDELQRWQEDCRARIDDLPNVQVIVPTGNTALSTFLGVPPWHARITQRRGSIYEWTQASGRRIRVIPIIHPAAVLRDEGETTEDGGKKNYEYRCRMDWQKVRRELTSLHIPVPPYRQLVTMPNSTGWNDIVRMFLAEGQPLAFDIETNPETRAILCISFANSPQFAVSVPWSRSYKDGIQTLLRSPLHKITQNGQYDNFWIRRQGMAISHWCRDTMAAHCLLYPGEPHSLAYLASVLTREPWYKGGDEDTEEKAWQSTSWEELLDYNARDSAVTWECDAHLHEELIQRGLLQTYEDEYVALFEPIIRAMIHGIRADVDELSTAFDEALTMARAARREAERAVDSPLFTFNTQVQEACYKVHIGEWNEADPDVAKKLKRAKGDRQKYIDQVESKGISNDILKKMLYETMKLPVQRNRATKKPTVDEAALLKLRQKFKDTNKYPTAMTLIDKTLLFREKKKQSEFLDPKRLENDGRYRSSYSFRPTTGRLSSAVSPYNTGGNAQNIDRELRRPFKPDAGCLCLEADLSQAEARIVYILTRDRQLLEFALLRPNQFDVHKYMAANVFEFGPWNMDTPEGRNAYKSDRYLSKRIVHASHYDLHGNKGSEILLKDGYDVSPKRFERLQHKYFDFAPGILDWQRRTRVEVVTHRSLTNAWGRRIDFPYQKFGDALYRQAYAWRPQSDIARHLNRAWIRLEAWLAEGGFRSRVNLQLHDALILSVFPDEAWAVASKLVALMEEPHDYYGTMLTVPAEIKLGTAWSQGIEWKQLPEWEEFEHAVETLQEAA